MAASGPLNRLESTLRRAAQDLNDLGRQWALVGGLAVSARTEPRFTRDIDLVVSVASDADAERLVHDLQVRGYRVQAIVEQTAVARLATARLVPPSEDEAGVVVDALFGSSGIGPEIVAEAEMLEVQPGLRIPVVSIGHLIALKLLSRDDETRPLDRADLVALVGAAEPADIDQARAAADLIQRRGFQRDKDLPAQLDQLLGECALRLGVEGAGSRDRRGAVVSESSGHHRARACCGGPHAFDSRRVRDSWWPRELRCLVIGESPGPPGALYFYDPMPDDTPDPIVVRRHLMAGLASVALIESPTLEAFRSAGFAFDHGVRCHLPTEVVHSERRLARRYSSPRAHSATHLVGPVAQAAKVWILGHTARDAVTQVCDLPERKKGITPPYVMAGAPKCFVSEYFRRFDSASAVRGIIESFREFFVRPRPE